MSAVLPVTNVMNNCELRRSKLIRFKTTKRPRLRTQRLEIMGVKFYVIEPSTFTGICGSTLS
jgi:hypothetical protein